MQPDHGSKHGTADTRAIDRIGFKSEDLDEVLKQDNQVLNVSGDDLENLVLQTEMHARLALRTPDFLLTDTGPTALLV